MKKRSLAVLLTAVMAVSMFLSACGGSQDAQGTNDAISTETESVVETEQVVSTEVTDTQQTAKASSADAEELVFEGTTEDGKNLVLTLVVEAQNQGNPVGTWALTADGTDALNGTFETDTYMFAAMKTADGAECMGIFERTDSYDVVGMQFDEDYVKFNREGQKLFEYGTVHFTLSTFVVGGETHDASEIEAIVSGGENGGSEEVVEGTSYETKIQVETAEYTGDITITLLLKEDGTYTLTDKWGSVNFAGTYVIEHFVVLKMTAEDGTAYTGCIQMDETYNQTGIIFSEEYDNGYEMTWTGLHELGNLEFTVVQ